MQRAAFIRSPLPAIRKMTCRAEVSPLSTCLAACEDRRGQLAHIAEPAGSRILLRYKKKVRLKEPVNATGCCTIRQWLLRGFVGELAFAGR